MTEWDYEFSINLWMIKIQYKFVDDKKTIYIVSKLQKVKHNSIFSKECIQSDDGYLSNV